MTAPICPSAIVALHTQHGQPIAAIAQAMDLPAALVAFLVDDDWPIYVLAQDGRYSRYVTDGREVWWQNDPRRRSWYCCLTTWHASPAARRATHPLRRSGPGLLSLLETEGWEVVG